LGGRIRVVWKQLEERLDQRRVKLHVGRQLPKDRTKLLFQCQNPRREEIRQRRLDIFQSAHVRDEPTALDGEDKIVRRLLIPFLVTAGRLQRIERTIDLD